MFSIVYFRIVFMKLFFIIICGSLASEIGNYSQYIEGYEWCGISMNAPKYAAPFICFAYHKEFVSSLRDARTPQFFETPWMISIRAWDWGWYVNMKYYSCGGALIADKWVLTAAHCVSGFDSVYVFIHEDNHGGREIEAEGFYTHPNNEHKHLDIALIKLKEGAGSKRTKSWVPNSICLPPKDFRISRIRYAMVSGFGGDRVLKIGPITITEMPVGSKYKTTGNRTVRSHLFTSIRASDLRVCPGDSGSPVWIYHKGRAVVVGVLSAANADDDDSCTHKPVSVFVPYFIDWIFETIKNN